MFGEAVVAILQCQGRWLTLITVFLAAAFSKVPICGVFGIRDSLHTEHTAHYFEMAEWLHFTISHLVNTSG